MFTKTRGGVTAPAGFKAAGISCGIKQRKNDLALIHSGIPCLAAGVFTTNCVKAAPVTLTSQRVARGKAQAVIINSGNANCCTGTKGMADAIEMAELTASALDISPSQTLVCSTGGIGKSLPMDCIREGIPKAVKKLSRGPGDAAEAILTTDLASKQVAVRLNVGGKTVTIGAMAKGSGMIQPNMATMLAFITTDANTGLPFMRKALRRAVNESFNIISVDGDMSTNDTVLLMANGLAGNRKITASYSGAKFQEALTYVCRELARKIVLDGEGATKFVSVLVKEAPSRMAANAVARKIANSPLVKTAIYGQNPNWGRIMSSIGSAGVSLRQENVSVFINKLQVVKNGAKANFSPARARNEMKKKEISVTASLGAGEVSAEIWTCDFSHAYVDINV